MSKIFKRKEDIQKVYGNSINFNEDYSKRFFVAWDDITMDNNIYILDKSKADYDNLGNIVEAAYLKNVGLFIPFFVLSFI
jgi:hypothetical protein